MNIIRNDRGLDFKRIEKLIEMFCNKTNKTIREFKKEREIAVKEREKNAYAHFGLQEHKTEIERINSEIEALKKKREEHESRIRDYTQGTNRYNSYDRIHEGSPIHIYINDVDIDFTDKEHKLKDLNETLADQLWLSPDIEVALEIINKCEAIRSKILEGK
ncbi:hypothetical protein Elgi_38440 [Paenibacillus elgii]|uniref:hypothetical protein n=1 Tax=Paenibacillus elgii TaxID=189691 RepID=UPI002D7A7AAF|nr:hypothetical protein Elgi_38440 [Paenibacillus elgii]